MKIEICESYNPILYFLGLLVNSPSTNDKSVGHLNSSFSRTKIAASQPETEKAIMDDAKKRLFEVSFLNDNNNSKFHGYSSDEFPKII